VVQVAVHTYIAMTEELSKALSRPCSLIKVTFRVAAVVTPCIFEDEHLRKIHILLGTAKHSLT
jgi:hypothetical protein